MTRRVVRRDLVAQGVVDHPASAGRPGPDEWVGTTLEAVLVEDGDVRPGFEVAVPLVDDGEVVEAVGDGVSAPVTETTESSRGGCMLRPRTHRPPSDLRPLTHTRQ